MSKFNNFRDGVIGPPIILTAICLVITFALAGTYVITKPVIAAQKQTAVNEVSFEGMPAPDGFVEAAVALPEGVQEAYMMPDGSYYVIKAAAKGFGGPVTFIVGLDADGKYTGIVMTEHTETPGLGTKVGEPDYLAKYVGTDDPQSVDSISGATITSGALKSVLNIANETYDAMKGA